MNGYPNPYAGWTQGIQNISNALIQAAMIKREDRLREQQQQWEAFKFTANKIADPNFSNFSEATKQRLWETASTSWNALFPDQKMPLEMPKEGPKTFQKLAKIQASNASPQAKLREANALIGEMNENTIGPQSFKVFDQLKKDAAKAQQTEYLLNASRLQSGMGPGVQGPPSSQQMATEEYIRGRGSTEGLDAFKKAFKQPKPEKPEIRVLDGNLYAVYPDGSSKILLKGKGKEPTEFEKQKQAFQEKKFAGEQKRANRSAAIQEKQLDLAEAKMKALGEKAKKTGVLSGSEIKRYVNNMEKRIGSPKTDTYGNVTYDISSKDVWKQFHVIRDTLTSMESKKKLAQEFITRYGLPDGITNTGQFIKDFTETENQQKKLTPEMAKQILQEVGGDKDKARKLAAERGYEF